MKNPLYNKFAASFAASSINSLVDFFNHEVGCKGWVSARAAFDLALIDEFVRRGIDVSAVYDGKAISFAHKVAFEGGKLIIKYTDCTRTARGGSVIRLE